ncbi:hypothetical protein HK100_005037 [Physocladia obscura]|uniref:Uncharacterized protein n=1 Tax=Physocladia obscura TaxID=109957 RepID=A0AAD5XMP2_9FUNG|nr:hypothetical protein HK100_005037 [Physocladia obscura]
MIASDSNDDDRDMECENDILHQEIERLVIQYGESRRNECAAVAELQRVADRYELRAAELRRKAAGLEYTLMTHCNPALTKHSLKNVSSKSNIIKSNIIKPPPITTVRLVDYSPSCLNVSSSASLNDQLCSPLPSSASTTATTPADSPSFLNLRSFPRLKHSVKRASIASNCAVVSPVIALRKKATRPVPPTSPTLPATTSPTTQSLRFATVGDNNILIRRELSSHSNTSESSTETATASTVNVNTSVMTRHFSPDSATALILAPPADITPWSSEVPSMSFATSMQSSLFRTDYKSSSTPLAQMQQHQPKLRRVRELGSPREFRIRELGGASHESEIRELAGVSSGAKRSRTVKSVTSTLRPESGISEIAADAGTNSSSPDSRRGSSVSWVSAGGDSAGGWSGQTLVAFQQQQQHKQQLEQQQKQQQLLQLQSSRPNKNQSINNQDWFEPVASLFVEETFSWDYEMKGQSGVTGESANDDNGENNHDDRDGDRGNATTEQVVSGADRDGNNFNRHSQNLTKRPSILARFVEKLRVGTPTFMATDTGTWK